jgi:voltage-gated potassium channel
MLPTNLNIGFLRMIRILRVFRIFRFLRFTADPDFFFGKITIHLLRVVRLILTILIIFFITSGLFWAVENPVNENVVTFEDAFYFSVVSLATVGFGDITPVTNAGRRVTVLMILSGIIFIPWQVSQIAKEWIHMSSRKRVTCPKCGLMYHDKDASHCKSCGHIIFQEYEGD